MSAPEKLSTIRIGKTMPTRELHEQLQAIITECSQDWIDEYTIEKCFSTLSAIDPFSYSIVNCNAQLIIANDSNESLDHTVEEIRAAFYKPDAYIHLFVVNTGSGYTVGQHNHWFGVLLHKLPHDTTRYFYVFDSLISHRVKERDNLSEPVQNLITLLENSSHLPALQPKALSHFEFNEISLREDINKLFEIYTGLKHNHQFASLADVNNLLKTLATEQLKTEIDEETAKYTRIRSLLKKACGTYRQYYSHTSFYKDLVDPLLEDLTQN